MLEAFIRAKSQMEMTQLVRQNEREFLTFIQQTRSSITGLLSTFPRKLDENNYGVSIPTTIEGVFLKDIDAERDLHMPDAAGLSMDVFIGRERVGRFEAWYRNLYHAKPRMVIDVAVSHKNVPKITNQVFIITQDRIALWDKKKFPNYADYTEDLPPGRSQSTQLIIDVLDYAAKHSKPSRSRK